MHKSLRMSPVEAAGISDRLRSWEEITGLIDAAEQPTQRGMDAIEQPKKCGP